jgi:hypothetical protein
MFERTTTLWIALTVGLAGFALALVGCSSNGLNNNQASPPDMSQPAYDLTPPPDLSYPDRDPTAHPDLPQVTNFMGPVLDAPEIWTVVWQGDEALGDKVQRFMSWMLQSDYWTQSLSEYGVHAGVAKGVIVLPSSAPATIDDTAIKMLVKSVITKLPEPINSNSVISFIIPEKSQSTMGGGGTGCQDYGGYHAQTRTAAGASTSIAYMVNLQCSGGAPTIFEYLTEVLSHEAAEASTDPFPFSAPGWSNDTVAVGGEIGDLCVDLVTTLQADFNDADAGTSSSEKYTVQRLYSQVRAAKENTDPCVPAPTTPYFNVAIEPIDSTVKLDATGNGSGVILIEPYAYGDVGPITWTLYGTGMVAGLTVSPKTGTALAGQTIRVDVSATTQAKGQQLPLVIEGMTADGTLNEWYGSLTIR